MTKAGSEFVRLIRWLNSSGGGYFVAWGYEELPEKCSGGDVDLYVCEDRFNDVAEYLVADGYRFAPCPYYTERHLHGQFGKAGCHTIHLFSSMCFSFEGRIVHTVLSEETLFRGMRRKGEMFVASPFIESFFSCLRYVSGRKDPQIVARILKSTEPLQNG